MLSVVCERLPLYMYFCVQNCAICTTVLIKKFGSKKIHTCSYWPVKFYKTRKFINHQGYKGEVGCVISTSFMSYFFFQQLSSADCRILDSCNFTAVDKDNIDFLKDVHSWKWYFACGKRMMIIGVGVSTKVAHLHITILEKFGGVIVCPNAASTNQSA